MTNTTQRVGAIACIVLDHGLCQEFDQSCVPGSDKKKGDRFAVMDDSDEWFPSLLSLSLIIPGLRSRSLL
jgi:hypothetical protein